MQVEFCLDGTICRVDEGYCQFFQTSEPNVVGQGFLMRVHPDELEPFNTFLRQFGPDAPFGHIVHRSVTPNGDVHMTEWTGQVVFDEDGNFVGTRSQGRIL